MNDDGVDDVCCHYYQLSVGPHFTCTNDTTLDPQKSRAGKQGQLDQCVALIDVIHDVEPSVGHVLHYYTLTFPNGCN